jgi:hypothetical protein
VRPHYGRERFHPEESEDLRDDDRRVAYPLRLAAFVGIFWKPIYAILGASGTYIELSFYSFWQREPLLLCEFFSSGQCDADRRLTYAEPFRNSGAGHAKLPYQ